MAHDCLEQSGQKPFIDSNDVLDVDKSHLQVDLGELRLAVSPQVLIAEAAGDLHVPIITRQHQQLLKELGRLRQSKKSPRVYAAGDQIVARAFRCALGQHRRFDLQKTGISVILARHPGNLVAQHQLALHVRAAQIQVAVFQTQRLVGVDIFFDVKRRGLGFGKNTQFLNQHFHRAGRHVRIGRRAFLQQAPGGDDIFAAHSSSFFTDISRACIINQQLNLTAAVAQGDENQSAKVSLFVAPAHQDQFLPQGILVDLGTSVGAF